MIRMRRIAGFRSAAGFGLILGFAGMLRADPIIDFTWNPPDGITFSEIVQTTQVRGAGTPTQRTDVTETKTEITMHKKEGGWTINLKPIGSYTMRDGKRVEDSVMTAVQSVKLTYELDGEGHIQEVKGFEKLPDLLSDAVPPARLDAVLRIVNPASMAARTKAEFHGRFGKFIGRKGEVGKGWEDQEQFTLPTGDVVKFISAAKIDERAQCGHHICVKLLFRYDTDSKSIQDFLGKAIDPVAPGGKVVSEGLEGITVEGGGERQLDPTTMLPEHELSRRNIRVKSKDKDGKSIETVLYEEREYKYEYPTGY